jgi:outer membrane protein TolC
LVKAAQAGQESQRYSLDLEKVSIEREIRNTVNRLHSSLRRLQLLEKNVILAEKNFSISTYRFTNGDIDAQTLALDRVRLNNAYLSQLDAYISYKLLLADLSRKTFYDFQNNKPYSYE